MLSTLDDVARVIADDEQFAAWSIHGRDDGYIELKKGLVYVVLAWPELWQSGEPFEPHLVRARSGNYSLVLFGSDEQFVEHKVGGLVDDHTHMGLAIMPLSVERLAFVLRSRGEADKHRIAMAELELELERSRYENNLLIDIGRALSQQRDIDTLLDIILQRARDVTGADAGSVYVVEGDDDDVSKRTLRFMESQNDSRMMTSEGFTMPVSPSSIVGACVLAGEVINIPDLYNLDEPGEGNNPWGFKHDRSWDRKQNYQTRSMVTVPMISARAQVIGVIQLINKRARAVSRLDSPEDFQNKVLPFDEVSINYARTLASQAGIALENGLLYDEVRTLFEGFVHASVTAIESRDPTTSGHSERVADLTVELAKITDNHDSGTYRSLKFNVDELKQIEYAALLHDFGKVGVREHVLVKAKKLYPHEKDLISARFDYIRASMENDRLRSKIKFMLEATPEQVAAELEKMDKEMVEKLAEIDDFIKFINAANQPTVLEEGGFERIIEIASRSYRDGEGKELPFLSPDEASALQIPRGSLTKEERIQIESHVTHTKAFLLRIPWGKTYGAIPDIAGAHHEKLDGSGYPDGLVASQIPTPAKMMTISDIFDALTAKDRPYKKAMPLSRALDILGFERDAGKLDSELLEIFIEAKVWERVAHSS